MTIDRAGFLRRWSERKLAAKAEAQETAPADGADAKPDAAPPIEPFDPASLPSIESLTADSDYTAFLRPGVPSALTNAALRQAWLSDPLISTFKEMADYDWDFNAPGYGALLPTDDVQALLSRVINRPEPDPEPEPQPATSPETAPGTAPGTGPGTGPEGPTAIAEAPDDAGQGEIIVAPRPAALATDSVGDNQIAALQHDGNSKEALAKPSEPVLRRPRHGGALPS